MVERIFIFPLDIIEFAPIDFYELTSLTLAIYIPRRHPFLLLVWRWVLIDGLFGQL
jgi:hypothetical protein